MSASVGDTRAVGAALVAGTAVTAIAAQALPGVDDVSSLRALGHGTVGVWLVLLAVTLVEECLTMGRMSFGQRNLPAWRPAVLLTSFIIPRFWADLTAAPVAAFWLVLLLACGAAIAKDVAGRRALRSYWVAASLVIAPWGLLRGVPSWP